MSRGATNLGRAGRAGHSGIVVIKELTAVVGCPTDNLPVCQFSAAEWVHVTLDRGSGSHRIVRAVTARLEIGKRTHHRFDMSIHSNVSPHLANASFGIDEECRALDAHIGAPVILLLDPSAVGLADYAIFI